MDLLNDPGSDIVDAILVEADDDRRRRAVFRDKVSPDEIVVERASPDVSRIARGEFVEQGPHFEAPLVGVLVLQRLHDGGGGEAVDPLDRVDALDVAADGLDRLERLPREQPIGGIGLERDDERAGAAELRPEALVVAVNGIVFREPRRDVVVDLRDVRPGRLGEGAEHDEDRERDAPPVDPAGKRLTHLVCPEPCRRSPCSSSRRLKAASFRPTL